MRDSKQFCFGNSMVIEATRSPTCSESLDWRGFCKMRLQNLERLRLRGQNLENSGVSDSSARYSYTASALTMICSGGCGTQGQISQGIGVPHPSFRGAYETRVGTLIFSSDPLYRRKPKSHPLAKKTARRVGNPTVHESYLPAIPHGPRRSRRASSSVERGASVVNAIAVQPSPWPRITTMEIAADTTP